MRYKPEYEYKKINTRDIFVDNLYQRDLSLTKVRKIVREFNPYLVNAVKVSFRDGKFWVFDGQHTIAALKSKYKGMDCQVDCKVFYGLTRLDEMELFIAQNGAATSVGMREKFRAMNNNGDPKIREMVKLCTKAGLVADFEKGQADNRIIATKSLYAAYESLDADDFVDMLKIIKEAWNGSPQSLVGDIIGGMSIFYSTYKGDFKRKMLVDKLKKKSPIEIVRDGKVSHASGPKRFARVILGIYNSNTSTNRLEDRL